jgi:hypothetical protein
MAKSAITFSIPKANLLLFTKSIDKFQEHKHRKQRAVVNEFVLRAEKEAKIAAPVGEGPGRGGLKRGIGKQLATKKPEAYIFGKAPHTPFVNYGTGIRGKATYRGKLPEGYVHGSTAGMEAQMFITKVMRDLRGPFRRAMKKAMAK